MIQYNNTNKTVGCPGGTVRLMLCSRKAQATRRATHGLRMVATRSLRGVAAGLVVHLLKELLARRRRRQLHTKCSIACMPYTRIEQRLVFGAMVFFGLR